MRSLNTRVLVIDDEEAVRDSFHAVLAPRARGDAAGAAARLLFDEAENDAVGMAELAFEVDLAENGRDGLALVKEALRDGRPYAAIFCDMRMPGWDGLQTVEAIREVDDKAEVVFVTAYSDHSIETIAAKVGENVGYFVKPFANEEVRQLANKLVHDWNKARELEALIKIVTAIHGSKEDMQRLLHHLLEQVCVCIGRLEASGRAAWRPRRHRRLAEAEIALHWVVGPGDRLDRPGSRNRVLPPSWTSDGFRFAKRT